MCDYSLHATASRAARVGETLVSTGFRGTPTIGFASPEEPDVAVCLMPGTELAFKENIKHQWGWFRPRIVSYNVAKFCKIGPESLHQHHDALEFPDGSTILINSLVEGQRLKVLQLPVSNTGQKSLGQLDVVPSSMSRTSGSMNL